MMLGAKAPDLDVCGFFRTTGSTGKYFKENKNNRRRAANSEAPVAVFFIHDNRMLAERAFYCFIGKCVL